MNQIEVLALFCLEHGKTLGNHKEFVFLYQAAQKQFEELNTNNAQLRADYEMLVSNYGILLKENTTAQKRLESATQVLKRACSDYEIHTNVDFDRAAAWLAENKVE